VARLSLNSDDEEEVAVTQPEALNLNQVSTAGPSASSTTSSSSESEPEAVSASVAASTGDESQTSPVPKVSSKSKKSEASHVREAADSRSTRKTSPKNDESTLNQPAEDEVRPPRSGDEESVSSTHSHERACCSSDSDTEEAKSVAPASTAHDLALTSQVGTQENQGKDMSVSFAGQQKAKAAVDGDHDDDDDDDDINDDDDDAFDVDSADESDEAAFLELVMAARNKSGLTASLDLPIDSGTPEVPSPISQTNVEQDSLLEPEIIAADLDDMTKDTSVDVVPRTSSEKSVNSATDPTSALSLPTLVSETVPPTRAASDVVNDSSSESSPRKNEPSDDTSDLSVSDGSQSRTDVHRESAPSPAFVDSTADAASVDKRSIKKSISKKFFRGNRKEHRRRSTLLSSLLEGADGEVDPFENDEPEASSSQDPHHQWTKVRVLLEQKKMLEKDIALWKKRIEDQQKENHALMLKIWKGGKKKGKRQKIQGSYAFSNVLLPYMSQSKFSGSDSASASAPSVVASTSTTLKPQPPIGDRSCGSPPISPKSVQFSDDASEPATVPRSTPPCSTTPCRVIHELAFSHADALRGHSDLSPRTGDEPSSSEQEASASDDEHHEPAPLSPSSSPKPAFASSDQLYKSHEPAAVPGESAEAAAAVLSAEMLPEAVDTAEWREERAQIVERLAALERAYASDLDRLVERALLPARQVDSSAPVPLTEEEVGVLFGDVEVLRGYNTLLLAELQRRAAEARLSAQARSSSTLSGSSSSEPCTPRHPIQLADLFLQMDGAADAYARYVCGLPAALALLERGAQHNEVVAWFRSRVGVTRPLSYLLMRPLLQLWSYHHSLEQFALVTPSAHPDREALPQVLKLFSEAVATADRTLSTSLLVSTEAENATSTRSSGAQCGVLAAVAAVLAEHHRLGFYQPPPDLRRRLLLSTATPCLRVYALSKRALLCGGTAASAVLFSDSLLLLARYRKQPKAKERKSQSSSTSTTEKTKRTKLRKWEKQLSLVQIVRVLSEPALLSVVVPDLKAIQTAFTAIDAPLLDGVVPDDHLNPSSRNSLSQSDERSADCSTPSWLQEIFAVVLLDETLILRADSSATKDRWCMSLTNAIQEVLL